MRRNEPYPFHVRLLVGLCLVGLGVAGAGCGTSTPERRPSGLLITLDTTIPEALGVYGGQGDLTPNLDRLAGEGIVFENARTSAPITLPAHASMLTGLYPVRHSVRRNGSMVLSGEASTLAEQAREAGFATAAVVSAVVLDPEYGLDQGFDLYLAPPLPERATEHLDASWTAADVVERALLWLESVPDERPFLLWVHFYDPHFPYEPPPAFLEHANGDPYLGEIAAMDAEIGRLLAGLEAADRLDDLWVVGVADHGEGLGRNGEDTHGYFVYDATLRVPFFVRPPAALAKGRAGERVEEPVSVVDVQPTLARALGLTQSRGALDVDGVDVLALADTAERGVYFESYFGVVAFHWSQLAGWATRDHKYVHSSQPELFDVRSPAGEGANTIDARPEAVEAARAAIAALAARPRLPVAGVDAEFRGVLGQIERLGYAGASSTELGLPEPLETSDLPSPHERVAAYAQFAQCQKLLAENGSRETVVDLLVEVLRENPMNHKAQFHLGHALMDLGRWAEAITAFLAVLPHPGGERIPAELNLAVCYYNAGQPEEALRRFESALADTIGPPGALETYIRLLEAGGRHDEAQRQRERLARERPMSPTLVGPGGN